MAPARQAEGGRVFGASRENAQRLQGDGSGRAGRDAPPFQPSSPSLLKLQVGVHLSKDLMSVAGHALKANITALGPRVLPLAEKLKFAGNFVARKILRIRWVRPYTPDFSASLKHVCIHTGGRGVIDEMEKQLRLAPATVAPSRDTLARYGNTSSSSIW